MILQYELLEDIKDDIRVLKEQNELLDIKLQILRKKILFDTIVFHGCAAFIIISMIAVSHMS